MDVTLARLAMCVDKEISTIDFKSTMISDVCVDSVLLIFDNLSKSNKSLIVLCDKIHSKHKECERIFRQHPSEITEHNYNMMILMGLALEMSFLL